MSKIVILKKDTSVTSQIPMNHEILTIRGFSKHLSSIETAVGSFKLRIGEVKLREMLLDFRDDDFEKTLDLTNHYVEDFISLHVYREHIVATSSDGRCKIVGEDHKQISLTYSNIQYIGDLDMFIGKNLDLHHLLKLEDGKMIIVAEASTIEFATAVFHISKVYLKSDGSFLNCRYGLLDLAGKTILDPVYARIGTFTQDQALIQLNDLFGVVDITGQVVVECIYEDILANIDDLIIVSNGKWGILSNNGTPVSGFIFDDISHFDSDGLTRVVVGGVEGVANKAGEYILAVK